MMVTGGFRTHPSTVALPVGYLPKIPVLLGEPIRVLGGEYLFKKRDVPFAKRLLASFTGSQSFLFHRSAMKVPVR
jgi:hypothetical protein